MSFARYSGVHIALISLATGAALGGAAVAGHNPVLLGIIAGLVGSALWQVSRLRDQQNKLTQTKWSALIANTVDAVISQTLDGVVTGWNDAATKLLGHQRTEALNHRISELGACHPDEQTHLHDTVRRGDLVPPFETTRRHRDGRLVEVLVSAAPIFEQDQVVGMALTLRDLAAHAALRVADLETRSAVLRENEAILSVTRTHAITSVTDLRGRIIDVSDAFCEITGYTRDELIGQSHRLISSRTHPPGFWREVWKTLGSGKVWRGEVCNRSKNGELYWVESTIAPYVGADGVVSKYVSVTADITLHKKDEKALSRANQRLMVATDAARIGVWEFDVLTHQFHWDDRMYATWGQQRLGETEPYQLWATCLHADDRKRVEGDFAAALRGASFDSEFRIVTPAGEVRHIKAAAHVTRDSTGKVVHLTGVNFDVSERRRSESRLAATSTLLSTVLTSASAVGIIATDPELVITVFNEGAQRMLGHSATDLVGRFTPMLIHDAEELRQRSLELTRELGRPIEGGAVFTEPSTLGKPRDWTYIRKDGSRLTVSLVCTEMRTPDGELMGYLGVARDISAQRESEDSLRDAMHKARQASQAKSQFLANMSHEIRTPMNAVIGLNFLLGQTQLTLEQTTLTEKLGFASKALLGVINDVLDLSKIEAGELMLEAVPFDLRALLTNLSGVMRVQAENKGVAFNLNIATEVPSFVKGDSTRLQQILTNLLSNAIKFTEFGVVRLAAESVERADGRQGLRFRVKDTGIGMTNEVLTKVFQPFAQADASTSRRFGGTGLGLSIVKRLANMMGGDVSVKSAVGSGSEFSVELDFELAERIASPSSSEESGLDGIRVLIVDDSDINLEVARRILQKKGATCTVASSGAKACALLERDRDAFDIVLMDIQMGDLDGLEATRRIRGPLHLKVPIIALTAGALTSEVEQARAAGMDDYVTKPFEPRMLVARIRKLLARDPIAEAEPTVDASSTLAIPGIHWHDVQSRLGCDVDFFLGLLRSFIKDYRVLEPLARTAKLEQVAAYGSRMHRLKGAAASLGAREVAQLAEVIEDGCRRGQVSDAAAASRRLGTMLGELARHADETFTSRSTSRAA